MTIFTDQPVPAAPRPPTRWLGVGALAAAMVAIELEVVAIVVGSGGGNALWLIATILGWVVIVLTAGAFALGLVAVITRRGRRWGAIAMVVAVLANPLVQIWVLGLPATS